MAFIVVYDANVLYPNTLRDLLIRIAQAGTVQALGTDQILEEMVRTVSLKKRQGSYLDAQILMSRVTPRGSIDGMKMSVSLPEEDVEFLDAYVRHHAAGSRSAALHEAVDLLRAAQLAGAYEDAWTSWESSDDADVWDTAVADGLSN